MTISPIKVLPQPALHYAKLLFFCLPANNPVEAFNVDDLIDQARALGMDIDYYLIMIILIFFRPCMQARVLLEPPAIVVISIIKELT